MSSPGVLPAPLRDLVGDVGDLHAEDERQARGLDRLLVRLGDHPRVRDDGDVGQPVGGHELLDDRQHGLGLGPVALEGGDHQREPVLPGEQPDRDLRLQPALLGEPGLAEPVALVGLEVEGGDVVKDQAGRAEPGMRGAGLRQPLPPGLLRIDGQAPLQGAVGRRRHPGLLQHPQAVELAGRLDDPGQHQVPEHLVPAGRVLQAQHPVAALQGVHQVAHPRRRDRQRPGRPRAVQAQAELQLAGRDPLLRRGLQRLQLRLVVRRPEVLDLPRPRREDHTTCTAVAPDVVFTVRMYGTRPLYGPRLVRKFSSRELQTHRSAHHTAGNPRNPSEVRARSLVRYPLFQHQ